MHEQLKKNVFVHVFFFVRLILIGLAFAIWDFVSLLHIYYTSPRVFITEWWNKLHPVREKTLYNVTLRLFHFKFFIRF